jgi:glycerol-3-phosphate dehydrogenase subunit C
MTKERHNSPNDCTACTSCVAQCPVTAATRQFHGPKMVGPALERSRLLGENDWEPSLEYCSNCKNCDITCPSGVPVSTLNMLAKAHYYKTHSHRLRDWILSHGETMAKMGSPTAGLTNLCMSNPLSRMTMRQLGISDKLPLPQYAAQTFMERFNALKQRRSLKKVVFYPGCFINYNEPQVGMDFVDVMQANDYEVIVPQAVCCSSPLVVNGYLEEAEANARHNVAELKRWIDKGYAAVTCCTSCGLMVKREYQELFDIKEAADVAAKLYDASEFIMELFEQGCLNTRFTQGSGNYLYHAPCHLRAQGIGRPSLDLLSLLPGIEVTDADAGCCGIAGNYGYKAEKYEIAMKIGEPLFEKIRTSGADGVISDCGTCRLQIAHATGAKVFHPISLLRTAYGV